MNDKEAIMSIERKTIEFEVKEVDEEEGTFTGYASTFSDVPDSYGDIVDPGAFKKTLKAQKGRIVSLFNHSFMEPIGKPTEMVEDEKGLLIKAKLSLGVQRARETLALMKDGVITQMSIGYQTIKEKTIDGIRHLQEIKLYDVSPVIFAANTEAVITGVKEIEKTFAFADQAETVLAAVKEWIDRTKSLADLRLKEGRVLSTANRKRLASLLEALGKMASDINELLEATKPGEGDEDDEKIASLAAIVSELRAENEGFDIKQAEGHIEAMLEKLRK